MKLSEKYHPRTVARKVLNVLQTAKNGLTPAGISRRIGYNPKTILKYVELLEDLGEVDCVIVQMGTRILRLCSIKPGKHLKCPQCGYKLEE